MIISFKETKEKFKHRSDIELCEDGFAGLYKKSKFFDLIENDYFFAVPRDVLRNNSCHPKRSLREKHKKLSLTFEKANEKFLKQERFDIQLCKDGYNGWTKKSKFFDFIVNDFFFSKPCAVYAQKSSHPRRSNNEILTFEKAKQKFIEQGRDDIQLCEDDYKGWSKKSKFLDTTINKYFFAIPKSVYFQKSSHPQLKHEKAVKTSKEKNGIFHLQKEQTIIKAKQVIVEKFGVEFPYQSKEIKNKAKQTNIKKYGVEFVLQNKKIQEKIKKTCLEKYNVEFYGQSKEMIDIKRKQLTKYIINNSNQSVKDWLINQPEPKPGYTTLIQSLQKQKINNGQIDFQYLKNFINDYKNNKTQLEVLGEQLFNSTHFNKKPEQIQKIYKPDFKLSETVYANVDGLYWHSEKEIYKTYHFELRKHFEENNLRLFQFYENEIRNKSYIVKSIINNSLGKTLNKIFARKCEIKIVKQKMASKFLNENHLMGSTNAKHIGLYLKDVLVCLMSYKQIKNYCKIERFCSLINYNIIGGFSKLLKYLECNLLKPTTTEIHNWVDLRYGTGTHLEFKGFKLMKDTLGWKWTDYKSTYNRLYCRANMDERKLTEKEHADELKLVKIYDAGQRLYIKKINK